MLGSWRFASFCIGSAVVSSSPMLNRRLSKCRFINTLSILSRFLDGMRCSNAFLCMYQLYCINECQAGIEGLERTFYRGRLVHGVLTRGTCTILTQSWHSHLSTADLLDICYTSVLPCCVLWCLKPGWRAQIVEHAAAHQHCNDQVDRQDDTFQQLDLQYAHSRSLSAMGH